MRGRNKADPHTGLIDLFEKALDIFEEGSSDRYRGRKPCVFISHQQEDTEACGQIADYLLNAGVDIYFDKYDEPLSQLAQQGNADRVTERILKGINASSHMICVVSVHTIKSYWVPFEVGFGYNKTELGVLTLEGIDDSSLPDYMKTTKVIRGTRSLNEFISKLIGEDLSVLESNKMIVSHAKSPHPLDGVMDRWK